MIREASGPQLVVLDLQSPLEQLQGPRTSDGRMAGDGLIALDVEAAHGVLGPG